MTHSSTPPPATERTPQVGWLSVIGPGILVAATGVGTGDLVTGALAGGKLGVAVLWAALLGAGLKFVLNEGLARWQLATGETVLEGVSRHFGRIAIGLFLVYLIVWTYFVAAALMSACGVAMHAIFPVGEADQDKLTYGIVHSLIAVGLVQWGGYRLFEKLMRVCIGLMFVTVMLTAVAVRPDWCGVLRGLLPTLPDLQGDGLRWTVGLMGGVGGTVTVLCYGYWIREEGRESDEQLAGCRIDLAVGYTMTALFGMAMVIIGSRVSVEGKSAELLVALSGALGEQLGQLARWTFLIGAWGAIFSSLLGVWQSVPYLFADVLRLLRKNAPSGIPDSQRTQDAPSNVGPALSRSWSYRAYLYGMATLPLMLPIVTWIGEIFPSLGERVTLLRESIGISTTFERVQLAYAVCGALFIPILAVTLLLLNGSSRRIGEKHRNRPLTTLILVVAVLMFVVYGYLELNP